ncbi:MAG: Flp pilus assembly protein CpaB [Phycisphaerae bacterium]
MNWKSWIPLIVALVLGLAAAKLAVDFTARTPGSTKAVELVEVVCLSADIAKGQQVLPTQLTTTRIPAEAVPAGVLLASSDAVARVARQDLVSGQLLFEANLLPPGTPGGLQATLPADKRALTVRIDEFSGVGGFLQPDSRVDVVSTFQGDSDELSVARTICESLRVVAVNRAQGQPDKDGNPTVGPATSVTLEVTPEEAEMIELASTLSSPRLVLRSSLEKEGGILSLFGLGKPKAAGPAGISLAQLRGDALPHGDPFAPTPQTGRYTAPETFVATEPAERRTVQIIRAGVPSEAQVQESPEAPAADADKRTPKTPAELITQIPLSAVGG